MTFRHIAILVLVAAAVVMAQLPKPGGSSGSAGTTFAQPSARGLFASRGTCSAVENGSLYLATDSFYDFFHCNGTSWMAFMEGRSVTPPTSGDYSWVNQNSATISTTGGAVYLEAPATVSNSLSMRVKSTPATPFTLIVAISSNIYANDQQVGICLRESGTGKIITFGLAPDTLSLATSNVGRYSVIKWTNATTFSAYQTEAAIASAMGHGSRQWLCLNHDGTNIRWGAAADGRNCLYFSSATKTNFFTTDADQFGFMAKSGTSNLAVGMTLLSVD